MSTGGRSTDFFVSYHHEDSSWAQWIAWQLEDAGYSTIIQAWDFAAGSNFVAEMDKALQKARRIIIVLSPSYLGSEFTVAEWTSGFAGAAANSRTLVPVRVCDVDFGGLIKSLVWIDLVGKDEGTARQELLEKVKPGRSKPASAPKFPGNDPRPCYPGTYSRVVEERNIRYVMVLTATFDPTDKPLIEALTQCVKRISNDASLILQEVRAGSVELIFEGSWRGFEELVSQFTSGGLKDIMGFPIESIRLLERTPTKESISALIALLRDNRREIREKAFLAVQEIGPAARTAVPALIEMLQDENGGIRIRVVEALGKIGPNAKQAVPALIAALQDESFQIRKSAVKALGHIGSEAQAAVPELIALMPGPLYEDAVWALESIGPVISAESPAVLKVLVGSHYGARAKLVRMMGPEAKAAVPGITRALLEENLQSRLSAAYALLDIGADAILEGIRALEDALRDPNRKIRQRAVQSLSYLSTGFGDDAKRILSILIGALQDEQAPVRSSAANALAGIGHRAKNAVPELLDALRDRETLVRESAVQALFHIGVERSAVPALIEGLADTSSKVVATSAQVIATIGPEAKAAVPALIAALQHSSDWVREKSAAALGSIGAGAKDAVPALIMAVADAHSGLGEQAVLALGSIEPNAMAKAIVPFCSPRLAAIVKKMGADVAGPTVAAVILHLQHESQQVRVWATRMLEGFGEYAEPAVPALISFLKDKSWEVRLQGTVTLGAIGPRAIAAVPALKALSSDEIGVVRDGAIEALRQIAGGEGSRDRALVPLGL